MAGIYLKSLTRKQFNKFVNCFDVVLSDCDGVLWKENEVIKGSPETFCKFKELGKQFFYVTNDNTRTRQDLSAKCKRFTYDAPIEKILCTSYLAASYLHEHNFKKKVYIVGMQGLAMELEAQGIENFGVGPDPMDGAELDLVLNFKPDPQVGAVIVGFDKYFSYPKLVKAANYALDPSVHFLGGNPDIERPSPNDNRFPDTGCLLSAIEVAVGRKALVLGKPEPYVGDFIQKRFHVDPKRTLMIGDNLNTDIKLGKRCGFTTLLVLSGITHPATLEKMKQSKDPLTPDFYADKLSDVIECLSES